MTIKKIVTTIITHGAVGVVGFFADIYASPVLIAPDLPKTAEISQMPNESQYQGKFRKDLKGSDFLHWGQGTVSVFPVMIALAS